MGVVSRGTRSVLDRIGPLGNAFVFTAVGITLLAMKDNAEGAVAGGCAVMGPIFLFGGFVAFCVWVSKLGNNIQTKEEIIQEEIIKIDSEEQIKEYIYKELQNDEKCKEYLNDELLGIIYCAVSDNYTQHEFFSEDMEGYQKFITYFKDLYKNGEMNKESIKGITDIMLDIRVKTGKTTNDLKKTRIFYAPKGLSEISITAKTYDRVNILDSIFEEGYYSKEN